MEMLAIATFVVIGITLVLLDGGGIVFDDLTSWILHKLGLKEEHKPLKEVLKEPGDIIAGKTAKIMEAFKEDRDGTWIGKVSSDGAIWSAVSSSSEISYLEKGSIVQITDRSGLFLTVDPLAN